MQSVFSKIFEKLLKVRLQSYIDKFCLLNKCQYGFRKNSSTKLALIDLVQTIELNQNKNKHTIAIFLDLRKAFDTVNHELLLKKLEFYGFRGNALQLFSSYLCDRKQFTHAMGSSSATKEIKFGVPQGSILGPLLFLIYINDITSSISKDINLKLFADDTAILVSHSNLDSLNTIANETMSKIIEWLNMNKLSLNNEKTYGMFFNANKKINKTQVTQINLQDTKLKFVEYTKYLGIIIDSKLSFKEHIHCLSNKLRKWIAIFRKVSPLLTTFAKYTLYNSLFYSNVLYGIEIYGMAKKADMKCLQVVQNKALKSLFRYDKNYPTNKLYSELCLKNIYNLFRFRASIMLKTLLQQPGKLSVHDTVLSYCSPTEHKYLTRDKKNFNLKFEKPSFTSSKHLPFTYYGTLFQLK